MKTTSIEWADCTFNPWIGCTKVSDGCKNCYAEGINQRFQGGKNWGKGAKRKRTSEANWKQPLSWNRENFMRCSDCGWRGTKRDRGYMPYDPEDNIRRVKSCPSCHGCDFSPVRPRVFCASMADWLDPEVPIEWLADLLALIRQTPNLDWLLLTKRPEQFFDRLGAASNWCDLNGMQEVASWINWWTDTTTGGPTDNVWVGASVENQEAADALIPHLIYIPAHVRFLSCEPLLGAVDLTRIENALTYYDGPQGIQWVICGGESGRIHPDWARSLRDQCAEAGVPFFFHGWGEWAPQFSADGQPLVYIINGKEEVFTDLPDGPDPFSAMLRVGKKASGRLLDGVEHNGFPEVTR